MDRGRRPQAVRGDRPGALSGTTQRSKEVLLEGALRFVGAAAFPALAYRLRWPTRLRLGGLVAYIAFVAFVQFAVRTWLVPWAKGMAKASEAARDQLREELGREPTQEELLEHFRQTPTVFFAGRV